MKIIKLMPYTILGLLIFLINSQINLNYLLKGYFTLIELQVVMIIMYFYLMPKIAKNTEKRRIKIS